MRLQYRDLDVSKLQRSQLARNINRARLETLARDTRTRMDRSQCDKITNAIAEIINDAA